MSAIGPVEAFGQPIPPPAGMILVSAVGAKNTERLGEVVDRSIEGMAQARQQREATDAERRAEEARRARAERYGIEEQRAADAVSRRFGAERQEQAARSRSRREEQMAMDRRAERQTAERSSPVGGRVDLYA